MPTSVQRGEQQISTASSRHLLPAYHAEIVEINCGVMSANAACQLLTNSKFNIGRKQNVHTLADVAQWCICVMATVGRQQRDNVGTKVCQCRPTINVSCVVADLLFILFCFPPTHHHEANRARSYSAKPMYEITLYSLPTFKEWAIIPLLAKVTFTITLGYYMPSDTHSYLI